MTKRAHRVRAHTRKTKYGKTTVRTHIRGSGIRPREKPLPKDLRKLTQKQTEETISILAKKPLKELRRRQKIVENQISKAFAQRNEPALANLQVMQNHLTLAIIRKTK